MKQSIILRGLSSGIQITWAALYGSEIWIIFFRARKRRAVARNDSLLTRYALHKMKDFKAELLFTCEKGMLLLRASFARTGTQEENSWAWRPPLGSSLLGGKKQVELCEIQASRGCTERPYLVLLRTHPT